MKDEKKYLQLLGKVLSREASVEEQQELEAWAKESADNQQFVEHTTLIWNKAEAYEAPINTNKEAAWANLESRIKASAPSQKTTIKALWYKVVAAVVIVAMGLGWFYQQQQLPENAEVQPVLATISTGEQEQKEINLPDGSTILLNEHSTISYDRAFKNRVVQLEGEAFFEVTKRQGQPFEVWTAATKTTVLGTSFNVRSYAHQATEIAVVTGKVAFESLDDSKKEHVLLLPKEMASYQKEAGITKGQWQDQNALAWKTQELIFDNHSLSAVLSVLERYYGVTIEGSEGLLNCHYTGNFSQAELEEVLNTIAFTFPTEVNIEKKDDKYLLTGQGCD